MSTVNQVIILHISDLHFGWDGEEKERTDRTLALHGLLSCLSHLEADWQPNIVCISGDIGWRGQRRDYEDAKQWVRQLLEHLKLSTEALIMCPGNHDLDRSIAKRNARPNTPAEADEVLGGIPIPEHFQNPFQAFTDCCKELGIPPFRLGETETYLVGHRSFRALHFISYNSAWFCKGDDDKSKLWIGISLIRHMEAKGQLPSPGQLYTWPVTIALMHHPKEWFHEAEIQVWGNRPNTFDYLSRRCHLLLTGHTHGEVRPADQYVEATWHLSGGATYAGASHFNSFRLIRVESDRFVYRSFEYDPRSPDNMWQPASEARPLPLRLHSAQLSPMSHPEPASELSRYREKAITDAQRLVETKSRALKPSGPLPGTLPLHVSVHVKGPRHCFTPEGGLITEPERRFSMPLFEAARQSRRTLLLGDLGSGKSTLAGMFVSQTLWENEQSLACIVPAKHLKPKQPLTVKELLRSVSEYFSEQISPTTPAIDLEILLNRRVEVSLVIDGLDEIPVSQVAALLKQLGTLVEHWPNMQVMATGRPVELLGVSYEDWQVLSTIPLDDDQKSRLLVEEAIAEGKTESEAKQLARELLRKLKTLPMLNSLAVTPLVIRLLYSRLLSIQEGKTLSWLFRCAISSRFHADFRGITHEEELERSLLEGYAIHTSATSAIIARLGTAPAGFRKRDTVGSVPALLDSPIPRRSPLSDLFSRLKELTRQSQRLHPDTCTVLEELIFESPLLQEDLFTLSNEGTHGVLVASALSLAYGWPPRPDFILKLLTLLPTPEESQDHCFQRLTRMWRNGHFKTIEEDPNARANYIRALDEALLTGAGEISAIATELLALRGNLHVKQIPLVFDHYTRYLAYDDYGLGNQLVKWLSTDLDQPTKTVLLEAIERGLTTLDGQSWEPKKGFERMHSHCYCFPWATGS